MSHNPIEVYYVEGFAIFGADDESASPHAIFFDKGAADDYVSGASVTEDYRTGCDLVALPCHVEFVAWNDIGNPDQRYERAVRLLHGKQDERRKMAEECK